MSLDVRLFHVAVGLVVLAPTLIVCFALFMAQMRRWGATAQEAAQALPGDEILSALKAGSNRPISRRSRSCCGSLRCSPA